MSVAVVSGLRSLVSCRVIAAGDDGYDESRALFYGWIDRRPAAIVKVSTSEEIGRVIAFAQEEGVDLAVRSGGHSGAGHSVCEGGIVIDLSLTNRIEIDTVGRTAWAETGMTAGQFIAATSEHGLATGFGDTGTVGIGGITLGGGIGFLVRKYGLTIDELLAAEVVTADGKLVRADEERHPDLFWAIRGGGGNFGVATRFKFRLREVDNVLGGMLFLPASPEVITNFISEADAAPEELSVIANVLTAPPMPFIPVEFHGRPVIMVMMVYAGPIDAGERAVARLRGLVKPLADMIRPLRYKEMFGPDGPHPTAASNKTMFMNRFDRADAVSIVDALNESKATLAVTQIRPLGGAMARVSSEATAFAYRDRRFLVNVAALYESPKESSPHDEWVQRLSDTLRKGDTAAYVNFIGDQGKEQVRTAYPEKTYERLAAIKTQYDPNNIFALNHNIRPNRGRTAR
jgi:FAD/FMN-containing dehydrogenase